MSISKIHGRFHFSCILLHFATIFGEKRALGPPRATLGGSWAVPWGPRGGSWTSAGALGRLPGRSGRAFWVKKWFLENVHAVEAPGVVPRVFGALWPLRALPAPFGTCHDAFGTCFVARAKGKKSRNFKKCVKFSNFPVKNVDFHENCYFFDEFP